jgi:trk system potassium uptake protein TrkA
LASRKHTDGVVVIGMGRFGKSLALELMKEGTEVLGIDADRKIVESLSGRLTHSVIADSTNEDAMRQLAVHEFDRAVIGVGNDLEASILSASVVLRLGVPNVWAKAISNAHAEILRQIGVHHVVRPEHDMGKRVAHLVRGRMLDYIEFDDGYAIVKTRPPRSIHGIRLGDTHIRSRYGVTIVGAKRSGQDFTHATAETVVEDGDLVIVSGPQDRVEKFSELA